MTEEKKQILKKLGIAEEEWRKCFISPDGTVYRENEHLKLTAEQVYQRTLKQIDICTEPTAEERIKQLEQDKGDLAANVYMLAEIIETLLGGVEDGQEGTTTEVTTD